jgi:RNA recognition motif-containing protein
MRASRRRKPKVERPMNKKLYIDNLPATFTENDLMDLFSAYGTIAGVKVQTEQVLGRSRSCGCVTMGTLQGARLAKEELNGREIGAYTLVISEDRPTEPRMGVIL